MKIFTNKKRIDHLLKLNKAFSYLEQATNKCIFLKEGTVKNEIIYCLKQACKEIKEATEEV